MLTYHALQYSKFHAIHEKLEALYKAVIAIA